MSKDLPPPVTRKSSKEELWKELECARAEIDQQQHTLNDLRDRVTKAGGEVGALRYQISVIRAGEQFDYQGTWETLQQNVASGLVTVVEEVDPFDDTTGTVALTPPADEVVDKAALEGDGADKAATAPVAPADAQNGQGAPVVPPAPKAPAKARRPRTRKK